jgi:molecular chaperone DnaJ
VSSKRDYYEVLGVSRNATDDEVRRAFRKLARQYHPDVNKDDGAEARFKEINEAYEVLSDQQKRRVYDQFGHAAAQGFGAGGANPFETFGFGDIFESFFGHRAGTATRRGPQRGADLRYDLNISFDEAIFGCEKELNVPRWETCPACAGTGAEPGTQPIRCPNCNGTGEVRRVQQSLFGQIVNVTACSRCQGEGRVILDPCKNCRGEGRTRATRHLSVTIPAGVDDGAQIKLTGEGEAGARGGPPGNLYVVLGVAQHNVFKRQGNDLLLDLPIHFTQATLGDEIEVPVVGGSTARLRIPPGTQSGRVFRMKDKGVPYLQSSGRGDMQVKVRVLIPSQLTDEQRALLVQLARSFGVKLNHPDEKGFLGKVKDVLGGA